MMFLLMVKQSLNTGGRLHDVSERIKKAGMMLTIEKYEFGCYQVKFLGPVVSRSEQLPFKITDHPEGPTDF